MFYSKHLQWFKLNVLYLLLKKNNKPELKKLHTMGYGTEEGDSL